MLHKNSENQNVFQKESSTIFNNNNWLNKFLKNKHEIRNSLSNPVNSLLNHDFVRDSKHRTTAFISLGKYKLL